MLKHQLSCLACCGIQGSLRCLTCGKSQECKYMWERKSASVWYHCTLCSRAVCVCCLSSVFNGPASFPALPPLPIPGYRKQTGFSFHTTHAWTHQKVNQAARWLPHRCNTDLITKVFFFYCFTESSGHAGVSFLIGQDLFVTCSHCRPLSIKDTQQSYYTGGCQQQVLSEGHALSQQGRVWVGEGGDGWGGRSAARAVTTAHRTRTRKGQWVCREDGGAGAEEDPWPASPWLGLVYPAEKKKRWRDAQRKTEPVRKNRKRNDRGWRHNNRPWQKKWKYGQREREKEKEKKKEREMKHEKSGCHRS